MVYVSGMRSALSGMLVVLAACGGPAVDDPATDAPAARRFELSATVGDDGLSEEVVFAIPPMTRSMTIVVRGANDALYALGQLHGPDGVDRVMLPAGPPGPAMAASYNDEQIGQMPGELHQSIRLGTFTHVYPYRPGQEAIRGRWALRVASDRPGPVTVTVLLPEDDGGRVLHLNVVVVSDTITVATPPAFLAELQRIFDQAGITVVVDEIVPITGTNLENIGSGTEPQEAPDSLSAMLPALTDGRIDGDALDLFIVETLPPFVAGLSLGTPGPPVRGSYYFGVVVRPGTTDSQTGRVVAHEVCHFLALQHVENVGVSGMRYPDPLDDTSVGTSNLMTSGTALTPDQTYALSRSALLSTN